MELLRRLLGSAPRDPAADRDSSTARDAGTAPEPEPDPAAASDDEATRDRELLRSDARRLDDELIQRQLRYADRSWTPPRQGGDRRAGDGDRDGDADGA